MQRSITREELTKLENVADDLYLKLQGKPNAVAASTTAFFIALPIPSFLLLKLFGVADNSERFLFGCVVFFLIITSVSQVWYARKICGRINKFESAKRTLRANRVEYSKTIKLEKTIHIKMLSWTFNAYILGTFVGALLWLMFPNDLNRAEPLTIVYGTGSWFFENILIAYGVPNFFKRLIEQSSTDN